MADNAIGTGALILSANADGLVAGLDKAEKATEKAAKKIADAGEKGGSMFGSKFKDALVGAFSGAAFGGVVAAKLTEFGDAIKTAALGTAEYREEVERATRAQTQLAAATDRSLKAADEWAATISDPKKAGANLEARIAQTERLLREQQALEESARKMTTKLEDGLSGAALGRRLEGKLDIDREKFKGDLAAAESSVDKLTERLADLREAKNRALDPTKNPELIGEVNRLTESLKMQRDTLGMTANQAKLYELRMKGATAAQLEQAEKIAEELDAIDARAKDAQGPKLGGAFERGSREAFSIVAKFQTGATQQADVQRKQLDALNGVKAGVGQMVQKLAAAQILKAM